ncbi:hypothetical protein A8924_3844 [Saccharopolyspora erythraea NRRL 2338]|uniref:Uncharacterized protein n=1 Tax=Saccharopolyspora erythraea (strain ATCC 11635 / DSM 40517 / JCM 4748 / NBRC 13426 / NCIMB 8594 / NRRL 2338) TaxID=405948 RepID=A4FFA1_SACEN|nr:hypothetical protein N599_34845 [Saccharopolyspora erythraea D]PFG96449.1 hypothetical protein A8924_3844 [Saccharopolyspora erythraea NRRL 2338]CAM02726.1 hypothetical protein SACE_3452 [Saccharopolyspora erythraea NRRL 2338]
MRMLLKSLLRVVADLARGVHAGHGIRHGVGHRGRW